VLGYGLDREVITQTLMDSALSDAALAQYQQHYQSLHPSEEAISV
jgi:hypothetical protein